jgi:hypothetical protein
MLSATALSVLFMATMFSSSFAQESNSKTELIPIDGEIGIEKTTLPLSIPENNKRPWAYVEGKISNHVPEYPVIIQIFDNDNLNVSGNNIGAVHFAQAEVGEDGTYEYKFRITDMRDGKLVHIFDGNYTVKIFKVVYLNNDLSAA